MTPLVTEEGGLLGARGGGEGGRSFVEHVKLQVPVRRAAGGPGVVRGGPCLLL